MSSIAYQKYRENSIYTSSKEELTLMLYNGLIKFIMQAINAIEKKKFDIANEKITRAEAIISEFINTIDKSFDISKDMIELYTYMNKRLLDANLKKDIKILNEVLDLSKEFRNTWVEAMKIAKTDKSSKNAVNE
jgi:flagellar protein FliS